MNVRVEKIQEQQAPKTAVLRRFADIEPQPLRWLWPGRIPLGKLTLLIGDPGLGKSLVTIDIAARITRGTAFPDGAPCEQGDVIILSAEDDSADTIRPRLDAAGADVRHVHYLEAVRVTLNCGAVAEKGFSLETDVDVLEDILRRNPHVRLIVIDPISAYLGGTESNTNSEVRGLLSPLAALAAKYGVAIVAITHLRKSSGAVVHRSIGSIAFTAAARAVWAIAPDPSDPSRHLFLPVKQNLAANVGGLAYRIEAPSGTPRLVWQSGSVSIDANDVLSNIEDGESSSARREAEEWLRDKLAEGPSPVKEIQVESKAAGHSWATIRRAKDTLSVIAQKSSYHAGWEWRLEEAHVEGAHPGLSNLSTFEQVIENNGYKNGYNHEDAQVSKVSTFGADDDGEAGSRQTTRPCSHCNEGKCHCPLCRRQGHCSVCDGIGRLPVSIETRSREN